jgi:hypothetical protein
MLALPAAAAEAAKCTDAHPLCFAEAGLDRWHLNHDRADVQLAALLHTDLVHELLQLLQAWILLPLLLLLLICPCLYGVCYRMLGRHAGLIALQQ